MLLESQSKEEEEEEEGYLTDRQRERDDLTLQFRRACKLHVWKMVLGLISRRITCTLFHSRIILK